MDILLNIFTQDSNTEQQRNKSVYVILTEREYKQHGRFEDRVYLEITI